MSINKNLKAPCPESASQLYRSRDRRLSTKLVPTCNRTSFSPLRAVYLRRALSTSDYLAARFLLETLAHTLSFASCLSLHATFALV
jgi:hypothetical protein